MLCAAMETESSSRVSPAAARSVADAKEVDHVFEKETFSMFYLIYFWEGRGVES